MPFEVALTKLLRLIDHFILTLLGVPTQPLSEREAEVDLVLIKSSFLFSRKLCLKNTSYHKNKMIYIIRRKGCI